MEGSKYFNIGTGVYSQEYSIDIICQQEMIKYLFIEVPI